jgi:peptidoglycan/xylan/chitin deacetylase (PgdA/CDA1 family)
MNIFEYASPEGQFTGTGTTPAVDELEEIPTVVTQTIRRRQALEEQPTLPLPRRARRRRMLCGLVGGSLVLLILVPSGIRWGPAAIERWFAPAPDATQVLQHVLHPETHVITSPGATHTAHLFMAAMLRKDWPAMWSMLAPDAQRLWRNEEDFTGFEQAKFGPLTLQSYRLGQTTLSHPWLDPDTTLSYNSAITLAVSLQAAAPPGLLTAPSAQALAQGLFHHTLLALNQNHHHAWQVLIAGPADPDAPVLVPAHPPAMHLLVPIFMYHHVSSLPTHDPLDYSLTVTTADFNAQLDWLQRQGYHSITMPELFDTFYDGKALPSRPVMLTFDDGYADVYTNALPVLLAHHYRGVFYIITGMIGGEYLTWDKIRTLARSGMEIASHTVHHVNVGHPPAPLTIQEELVNSKEQLQAELDVPIQFFCYPSGEPFHHDTLAERQRVLADLFQDGYVGATLDPAALNSTLQDAQAPYAMPRVRVSGGETLEEFVGILAAALQRDQQRLRAQERAQE